MPLAFSPGAGDSNSGPHACVTGTLPTEPSPQSSRASLSHALYACSALLARPMAEQETQRPLRQGSVGNVPRTRQPTVNKDSKAGRGLPSPGTTHPIQEAKLQGGQRLGNFWITLGDGTSPLSNPLPLLRLLHGEYGLRLPAGTRQLECSRGFPVGIIWAGMFSWVSCWNSMKSTFILPAVCPWSLWGAGSRGIPKSSPLSLPTVSRLLISVETWSSDQCAVASATGRWELSPSHSQLAAGNRPLLQVASPEPRKEVEWGDGQVGSYYLGLGSSYLCGWLSNSPTFF